MMGSEEEATAYYERAIEIGKNLPSEIKETFVGLTSQAAALSNFAGFLRDQQETDRAMKLLDEAVDLENRALSLSPNNPVAADFLFQHYRNLSETYLEAGRHEAAAKEVETLVWAYPERLEACHFCAEILLRCAALADTREAHAGEESGRGSRTPRLPNDQNASETYRKRAHELVAQACQASLRTPDSINAFARFLLVCSDDSFRDPRRALELAASVVKDIPQRADAWLTLGLAHYRLGQWQEARDAVQKSVKFAPSGLSEDHCRLLSMISYRQGRNEEARRWFDKAGGWTVMGLPLENEPFDKSLARMEVVADAQLFLNDIFRRNSSNSTIIPTSHE